MLTALKFMPATEKLKLPWFVELTLCKIRGLPSAWLSGSGDHRHCSSAVPASERYVSCDSAHVYSEGRSQ